MIIGKNLYDISVIIPTLDRCELLRRALDSVLKQTKKPREIIVVDNGSKDNTYKMVTSLFSCVNYLKEKQIDIIAYSSLVPLSTWRHKDGENSKKTNEMQLISESEDSPFKQLSIKYNVTEAQFLLKWALELGYSILPKSIESKRMKENFNLDFSISQIDMDYIKSLDRGGSITWEYGDPLKIV